jgi:hypothetical protein
MHRGASTAEAAQIAGLPRASFIEECLAQAVVPADALLVESKSTTDVLVELQGHNVNVAITWWLREWRPDVGKLEKEKYPLPSLVDGLRKLVGFQTVVVKGFPDNPWNVAIADVRDPLMRMYESLI